jgi:hypothetical protein
VRLTATPATGHVLAGWGGACAAAGTSPTCEVALVADATAVTASFAILPPPASAASDLLRGNALTADERTLLDRLGNADGVYNLGDVLALLDRTGQRLGPAALSPLLALPSEFARRLGDGAPVRRGTPPSTGTKRP